MPFFKHSGKLIYFAHVPKCAGTSIENYLVTRYGPAAFLDRKLTPGNKHNWCRTSPQHLSVEQLDRLFPEGFFDAGFAFVRDPLARVRSAFHFHQTKRKKIPAEESFEEWLPRIAEFDKFAHARFDDHFRPQGWFVPQWCKIFRLEDGFDDFIPWLDEWSGDTHSVGIGRALVGKYQATELPPALRAFVRDYYADDYARFGLPDLTGPVAAQA